MYPLSGIGWMITGRWQVGVLVLLVRSYLSLYTYARVLPRSAADPVSNEVALATFLLSMAIAAASVLALAYTLRHATTAGP